MNLVHSLHKDAMGVTVHRNKLLILSQNPPGGVE
jgi:hypothetical protein